MSAVVNARVAVALLPPSLTTNTSIACALNGVKPRSASFRLKVSENAPLLRRVMGNVVLTPIARLADRPAAGVVPMHGLSQRRFRSSVVVRPPVTVPVIVPEA